MKIQNTVLRSRNGTVTQFLLTMATAAGFKVRDRSNPNLSQAMSLLCDVETKTVGFFDFNQRFDGPLLDDRLYESVNDLSFTEAGKQLNAEATDLVGLPVYEFDYPEHGTSSSLLHRVVIVFEANEDYINGLEVTDRGRFKKFLQSKTRKCRLIGFKQKAVKE